MYRTWKYDQASSLKRLEIDPTLRGGICKAMTYEWLKRQLAGLSTTPEIIERSIFRMASMQRAPLGLKGQVVGALVGLVTVNDIS